MNRTLAFTLLASTLAFPAYAQMGGAACSEQAASLAASVQSSPLSDTDKTRIISGIEAAALMDETMCAERLAEIEAQDLQSGRASSDGPAGGMGAPADGGASGEPGQSN